MALRPRLAALLLVCFAAQVGALNLISMSATTIGRRSILAASIPVSAIASPALAESCLGKCPDPNAEAKAAERRAIQTGSKSAGKPLTFAEMLEKSVKQREETLGMSLSEDERKELEQKMRLAFPGVQ